MGKFAHGVRQLRGHSTLGRTVTVESLERRCLLAAQLVADVQPGYASSNPADLTELNGHLYFTAKTDKYGLWTTNGSLESTRLVRQLTTTSTNYTPRGLITAGGKLFLSARDPNSEVPVLWTSDGTAEGTTPLQVPGLKYSNWFNAVPFNGRLFFPGQTASSGEEPWISDGTATGTIQLADIYPGSRDCSISEVRVLGGTLYFIARDSGSYGVYKTDGTPAGTSRILDITLDIGWAAGSLVNTIGDKLLILSHGNQLLANDGTGRGAMLIHEFDPYASSNGSRASIAYPIAWNGALFFSAYDSECGWELWRSDGTSEGTFRIKDINPGKNDSDLVKFVEFNNRLYFLANDGVHGREWWSTDGTESGTQLVADSMPGSQGITVERGGSLQGAACNGLLYYVNSTPEYGTELWQTDGTPAGTRLAEDVWPGPSSSIPYALRNIGGNLYFIASDSIHGKELWRISPDFATMSGGQLTLRGTAQPDEFSIDVTDGQLVVNHGVDARSFPLSTVKAISMDGNGSRDTLTIDCTNGNPLEKVSLSIENGAIALDGGAKVIRMSGLSLAAGATLDIGEYTLVFPEGFRAPLLSQLTSTRLDRFKAPAIVRNNRGNDKPMMSQVDGQLL